MPVSKNAAKDLRTLQQEWSKERARAYLQEQAGQHFDPRIVDIFLSMLDKDGEAAPIPATE